MRPTMMYVFAVVFVFLTPQQGEAAPQFYPVEGRLLNADGSAIVEPSVDFQFEILSPVNDCVLYVESFDNVVMTNSDGYFSFQLGNGTRPSPAGYETTSAIQDAFDNSLANIAGLTCSAGSNYDPAPGEGRKLRVTFDDKLGGGPEVLTQNYDLGSVPFANYAQSLQGLEPADLISVNTGTANVSQASLETVFNAAGDVTELRNLIDGASAQYISSTPGASVNFNNQEIIGVAAPTSADSAVNRNYADGNIAGNASGIGVLGGGNTGEILQWNGSQWVTAALGAGDVSQGGNSFAANMVIGTNDAFDLVLETNGSARLTVGSNGGVLADSLGVTGGINVGSVLQLQDGDSNYVGFVAPANAPLDQTWVLPAADGTANQLLSTDGAGNLSFVDPASLSETDPGLQTLSAAEVDQLETIDANTISNAQWGYLSNMGGQPLESFTESDPGLQTLSIAEVDQLENIDTNTITNAQWGYLSNMSGQPLESFTEVDPGLQTLTTGEVDQLENIDTNTITNAQWGYLANMGGQPLESFTEADTFANVTSRGANTSDNIQLDSQAQLRLGDDDNSNFIALRAPAGMIADQMYTLPGADGTSAQVLATDGSGNFYWKNDAGAGAGLSSGDVLDAAVGTVALPGITFNGDLDTGLANTAANNLAFSTGGTQRMLIANDGSISILGNSITATEMSYLASMTAQPLESESDPGLQTLSAAEVDQLENLDSFTITNTHWGYLANMTAQPLESFAEVDTLDSVVGRGAGTTFDMQLDFQAQMRLGDDDNSHYVSLSAPNGMTANANFILPGVDGTSAQVLATDGSGNFYWKDDDTAVSLSIDDLTDAKSTIDAVFLGSGAGASNGGTNNVAIGRNALTQTSSVGETVAIGRDALFSNNAGLGRNTAIGYHSGRQIDTGENNILLGHRSGDNITSGSNNIVIGYNVDAQSPTADDNLNIGNLIFSDGIDGFGTTLSSGSVGIGTAAPQARLDVEGDIVSGPMGAGASQGGHIKLQELAASGDNFVGFRAPDVLAFDMVWQLPAADGTSGQVLQTDGSGHLSWATSGAGADDLGDHIMDANLQTNGNWISGDGGNEGIYIGNSGEVGIGTSAPIGALDVFGNSNLRGNVGINTSAPSNSIELEVGGHILMLDASVPAMIASNNQALVIDLDNDANEASEAFRITRHNQAQELLLVNGNGVGIGTTVISSALTVAGDIEGNRTLVSDGLASSPSISFNLDPDSGLFKPGANQLAVALGGLEEYRFDNSQFHALGKSIVGISAINGDNTLDTDVVIADEHDIVLHADSDGGGVGGEIRFELGSPQTIPMIIKNNGRVGIGTTSPSGDFHLQTAGSSKLRVDGFGTGGSNLEFQHARGAPGSESATMGSDRLASIKARGYGATTDGLGAEIRFEAPTGWSDSSFPTAIHFGTVASGQTSAADRMIISDNGDVNILDGLRVGDSGNEKLIMDDNSGIIEMKHEQKVGAPIAGQCAGVADKGKVFVSDYGQFVCIEQGTFHWVSLSAGPVKCPTGWSLVGNPGLASSFCIKDDAPEDVTDYYVARSNCRGYNVPGRGQANICSREQLLDAASLPLPDDVYASRDIQSAQNTGALITPYRVQVTAGSGDFRIDNVNAQGASTKYYCCSE